MQLYNNTSNEIYYGISTDSGGDCGNIAAGDTADLPAYDNQTNVVVKFTATPVASPFSVTIDNTGTGKVVTIGLYHE